MLPTISLNFFLISIFHLLIWNLLNLHLVSTLTIKMQWAKCFQNEMLMLLLIATVALLFTVFPVCTSCCIHHTQVLKCCTDSAFWIEKNLNPIWMMGQNKWINGPAGKADYSCCYNQRFLLHLPSMRTGSGHTECDSPHLSPHVWLHESDTIWSPRLLLQIECRCKQQ